MLFRRLVIVNKIVDSEHHQQQEIGDRAGNQCVDQDVKQRCERDEPDFRGLFHKGLMYRYNSKDDFGLPTSAFTICTFWLIRALFVTGHKEEARCLFDEVLKYSNHLGLFSEDIDFETKEQLGNFPQAYSHLALVNTAILFAEEEKRLSFIRP